MTSVYNSYIRENKSRQIKSLNRIIAVLLLSWLYLEVPYLSRIIPYVNVMQLSVLLLATLEIFSLAHKGGRKTDADLFLLIIFLFYLILVTFIKHASLSAVINRTFPIFVFSFYIYVSTESEVLESLRIWEIGLFLLLIADMVSMFVFPNGMYQTVHVHSIYSNNWFLGYKTRRLLYTFPLLAFIAIRHLKQYGSFKPSYYIIALCVIWDAWRSDGTGALISVIIFVLFSILIQCPFKLLKRVARLIIDYRFALIVFIVSFVFLVLLGEKTVLNTFATDVLMKSETFSGRASIWQSCVSAIKTSPLIGLGMLDSTSFELLTNGAVNSHNQLLEILLNGGVIGASLYIIYSMRCVSRKKSSIEGELAMAGASAMLFGGLFSAVYTYSVAFFLLLALTKKGFDVEESI